MDNLKNIKGYSLTRSVGLTPIIEQTPRKRTILTGYSGRNKKSYYLAFPYVQLLPSILITPTRWLTSGEQVQQRDSNTIIASVSLTVAMSKKPFNFKKLELHPIPLPNVVGFQICGSNKINSKIYFKKDSDVLKTLSIKIDLMVADFWNSCFVSRGGSYPDLRTELEEWEKRSEKNPLAAFKAKNGYTDIIKRGKGGYKRYVTSLIKTAKSPKDFPKALEKYLK